MIAVQEEIKKDTTTHGADVLGAKTIFHVAGNRILRIESRPRGKMADIPLQKSKMGLTSVDVLDYLREVKISESTTPSQADGVCCSPEELHSGVHTLFSPQGAGYAPLRHESIANSAGERKFRRSV
jgi:hypothetical protein